MRSPVFVVLAVYWTLCVLSYGIGVTRPLAGAELARADRQIIVLTLLAAIAILIIEVAPTMPAVRRLSEAFVTAVAFLALVAVLQGVADIDLVEVMRLPGFSENLGIGSAQLDRLGALRVRGTATHPIEAGTLLAAALPLTLHVGSYARTGLGRFGGWTVSLLVVLGAMFTLSRSAMVGLAVALLVMLPRWNSVRRFRVVVAGAVAVAVLAMTFPRLFDLSRRLVTDFFGSDIAGADLGGRTEDYDVVRGLVAEHPVLGRGFGTFDPNVNFATDNQALKTLIEVGVVGLAVVIVLVVVAMREAKVGARAATDERDRDLALSVQTSFALVALSMLFYDGFSFLVAYGTFFFLVGLCGALGVAGRAATRRSPDGEAHPSLVPVGR